ncbi:fumarylacetoacetate hydrolase family protein [Compostibacter hankyongensis]|uniref:Fumarylacetoacetate hydrolase family protein n=1 Tax=Compostibacter hankyongensis TaxID=1007089 RepID=A0ABP8FSV9_9BACT
MKLYNTTAGILLQDDNSYYRLQESWDELINREGLHPYLAGKKKEAAELSAEEAETRYLKTLLPPIGSQEVWAAGVTYMRSRDARMEESKETGGAGFYDKVYEAERPELFFKALPHRVSGPEQPVYIRQDSSWNVPEPELTLFINAAGSIQGYTVGNDMSSRSIEGENPLYLPQAKVYERSAALGPCLFVPGEPISPDTCITMTILRKEEVCYKDSVTLSRMKRTLPELAGWLYKASGFPAGSFLMTGTCLVPEDSFTLQPGDRVEITIDDIGTLVNRVEMYPAQQP